MVAVDVTGTNQRARACGLVCQGQPTVASGFSDDHAAYDTTRIEAKLCRTWIMRSHQAGLDQAYTMTGNPSVAGDVTVDVRIWYQACRPWVAPMNDIQDSTIQAFQELFG